ncbi:Outer membrane protein beta-barrel domain-containing protein [Chitinophaga eiseniae]|uniref:Outer membrane protein beta-barrel domain-containing protein n=1 Tax=Chitinophaga eiseniae TaxID=634771 RepID=A0A1T4Q5F8_9BACT|nr:porin family protein [Chitinophaga eiseniae]SJZ98916.1 Outer membrane protein beta-barrel domain-containing protein [Chitinophaga eiseniae]
MRKILFVLLAVMSVAVGAYAQKKVSYGLKGGLNLSNYNAKFDYFRAGIYAGVFAEIKLKERWAVQPEIMYYRNGGRGTYMLFSPVHNASERKEDYISIPIMFKYYALPKLYLEAGPEVNYVVSAKEKADGRNFNLIDSYQDRLSVSGSVGIGYQLPRGFGINARYSYSAPIKAQHPSFHNNTGKIGFTYTFQSK